MFGFEKSIFLYALALVILPVIIHLFGIKRPQRVLFAPLPIILKIKSRVIKKKRLHSIILILLRMMLFALVIIAFAGIFVSSTTNKSEKNNRCMFIIDNSPSSMVRAGGKRVLEYLSSSIEDYLNQNENICRENTIYTLSNRTNLDLSTENLKKGDWVKQIIIGNRNFQMVEELEGVISLSRDKNYRKVILVSDMYSHFVGDISKAGDFAKSHNIEIISPVLPSVANAFIEQVRFEKGESSFYRAIVSVKNGGEAAFYGSIQFYDGERLLSTESINLPADENGEVEFLFQSNGEERREHLFSFRIEGDDFEYDNTEYVYFKEGKKGKVLLVNGEPSSNENRSEIFYLKNAILSYFGESLQLYTVLEDMLPDTPQLYDVIALCNVNRIDEFKADLLLKYITDGGRLFITLGSRISISDYNNIRFIPGKIKSLIDVDAGESIQISDNLFFESLSSLSQGLKRVRIMKLFDVSFYPESVELLRISSGKPLLLLRDIGKGSVLLYTTSIDMDMSDFPIRKVFIPFVATLFEKMLGGLADKKVIYTKPEEEFTFNVISCEESDLLIAGKKEIKQKAICRTQADGSMVLGLKSPDETGFYIISYGKSSVLLVVNADKEESILKRVEQREITDLKRRSLIMDESSPLSGLGFGSISLVELILFLSAIVLILEMFVMNRR